MKKRRSAFTLAELLIVVIVLGVLAGVSVPKLSRMLETRKTAEAEQILSAVRMEQEKRCLAGKTYYSKAAAQTKIPTLASAKNSAHYSYEVSDSGSMITATPKDGTANYTLNMYSRGGELCCSGPGCDKLNKNYVRCNEVALSATVDECAVSLDACTETPDSCACATYAEANQCACSGICTACETDPTSCECLQTTAACCTGSQVWNGSACVDSCVAGVEDTDWTSTEAGTDECDGDVDAQFTCGINSSGTCVDIYSTESTNTSFASAGDPFNTFRNGILLAGAGHVSESAYDIGGYTDTLVGNNSTIAIGEDLGTGTNEGSSYIYLDKTCSTDDDCPVGQSCSLGKCSGLLPKDPDEPGDPVVACLSPKQNFNGVCACYDPNAQVAPACLNGTYNNDTCSCEESTVVPDRPVRLVYHKRLVTCCGKTRDFFDGDVDLGDEFNVACTLQQRMNCESNGGVFDSKTCECLSKIDGGEYHACTAQACEVGKHKDANCNCVCDTVENCTGGTWDETTCTCAYSVGDRFQEAIDGCQENPNCGKKLANGVIGPCVCLKTERDVSILP